MRRSSPNWPQKAYRRKISADLLNPSQFLVHEGLLGDKELPAGESRSFGKPVSVFPVEGGRWSIGDGHHRAFTSWMRGEPVEVEAPHVHESGGELAEDSGMRMEDMHVVRSGEEGEEVEVDRPERLYYPEGELPVWLI